MKLNNVGVGILRLKKGHVLYLKLMQSYKAEVFPCNDSW